MKDIISVYYKGDKLFLSNEKDPSILPNCFLIFEREIKKGDILDQDYIFNISKIIYSNFDLIKDEIFIYNKYVDFQEKKEALLKNNLENYLTKNFNKDIRTEDDLKAFLRKNIYGLKEDILNIYLDFKDYLKEG